MKTLQDLITETKRLAESATPGPWEKLHVYSVGGDDGDSWGCLMMRRPGQRKDRPSIQLIEKDFEFIPHSANLILKYAEALDTAAYVLRDLSSNYDCDNYQYADGRNCGECQRCKSATALSNISKILGVEVKP